MNKKSISWLDIQESSSIDKATQVVDNMLIRRYYESYCPTLLPLYEKLSEEYLKMMRFDSKDQSVLLQILREFMQEHFAQK